MMMSEENKNFIVYKHTNMTNGKVYIGITGKSPQQRWGKDGKGYMQNTYFWHAIQKYGWDNFKHEILFDGLTKEQALDMEAKTIAEYHANDSDYGYNLTSGGEHNIPNEVVRQKMSEIMKGPANPMLGRKHTEEELAWYRERFSGEGNPRYGVHLSEETKAKISNA